MLSGWNESTITVNEANLHYYQLGTSGKPVLVLVHGFSDNGLCWQPVAEELKNDYQIFMPDMRGHGLSSRVQVGEKFDMVSDLKVFIETLGLTHPILAGHSMGASIAFHFTARFPALPKALILEDPPWFEQIPERYQETHKGESPFAQFVDSLQGQTADALFEHYRKEHSNWHELSLQRWCEAKTQLDPNFISIQNIPHAYWKDDIQAITCPMLLITADPDLGGIITPEMAQTAMEMKPNLLLVYFPEVGHHIRFATHDVYMQKLKEFLNSL